jgi:hypothetical protein
MAAICARTLLNTYRCISVYIGRHWLNPGVLEVPPGCLRVDVLTYVVAVSQRPLLVWHVALACVRVGYAVAVLLAVWVSRTSCV